jgi:CsoR family transcriptional regulator, copper-sensing transcriptional repressor
MKKLRTKDTKQKLIHRLKIADGHLRKIISMVEKDEYCINIVHQSLAVQSALRQVDHLILNNHLKTCVADSIRKGKVEETTEEVMKVIEKL